MRMNNIGLGCIQSQSTAIIIYREKNSKVLICSLAMATLYTFFDPEAWTLNVVKYIATH